MKLRPVQNSKVSITMKYNTDENCCMHLYNTVLKALHPVILLSRFLGVVREEDVASHKPNPTNTIDKVRLLSINRTKWKVISLAPLYTAYLISFCCLSILAQINVYIRTPLRRLETTHFLRGFIDNHAIKITVLLM